MSISKAERSFIQAGLLSDQADTTASLRADGRGLHDYRMIQLETGVAPLSNGSARISIGKNPTDGSGGTEVIAASKLEVETESKGRGKVVVNVTCSPTAYPYLSSSALDETQHDLTTLLHETLSHSTLHPENLGIIPRSKAWCLYLDLIVLADGGNVFDALFMAARAALWDTKVPRTRAVEYKAPGGSASKTKKDLLALGGGDMDVDDDVTSGLIPGAKELAESGFDTRKIQSATDFELPDYWDEGEALSGRDKWPVCVTLNILPPIHVLDTTLMEEASIPLKVLFLFSFPSAPTPPSQPTTTPAQPLSKLKQKQKQKATSAPLPAASTSTSTPTLQALRTLGSGELTHKQIADLLVSAQGYAKEMMTALEAKLEMEEARRNQKAQKRFAAARG